NRGYFFAPDPSSQMVSSIGGNVSTNAGGPHCLKYGITTNHVLGLELVTGTGEAVRLGGKVVDRPGYDLTGIAVGSEGTFGIVTAVTVRLLHAPEAVRTILASFVAIEDASEAVSAIIAAGMIPAALEMLDEMMIRAINEGSNAGYPKDAAAVLLIELDGPLAEVMAQSERAAQICWERGALEVRVARDDAERALLWKGRKEAAGAVGRLAPTYLLQDAVVPRSKLPTIMRELIAIGARHRVRIANVFHAGDGNLHPLILYDDRDPGGPTAPGSRRAHVSRGALGGQGVRRDRRTRRRSGRRARARRRGGRRADPALGRAPGVARAGEPGRRPRPRGRAGGRAPR